MAVDPNAIWAQASLDPSYLAQHGSNTAALKALILGYGSSSALSPQLASQYGITPDQVSAADTNPYSVQSQLAKQLSGDQYGITNAAQSHGALFSGAHAAAKAGELQNAGQRNYGAQQTLAQQIAGIQGNDTTALTNAYGTLTTNALNTPQPAPAPAAPTAPVATPSATYAVPQTAGNSLDRLYDQANPVQPVAIKAPKLPKLPSIGGMGHIT